ncbi:carboxypeptidase regulatory-like domain-containing protein, partial [Candidatus Azambacteria bacterium]|nr:carboxypeptidase regulatory-like domain-containing protein [Candidatus Azambacteria bacterium]
MTGYKIYRNGVYLTYTSSLSYQDAGLLASTPYSYTIAAYDAAGNVGPQSVITSVVTSPALITPTMLSGKAVNASGVGVANVWVNAEQSMNGTFVQTKTGTDGSYALTVSAGDWSVNAYPEQSLGYNYAQGARRITVLAGVAVTVHFTLDSLDAQITGSIVDAAGQVISTAYGYVSTASSGVYSSSTAATTMSFGGSIDKGIFSFHVPQGTYALSVYFPSNSAIAPPPPQTVTVGTGEIKKINFVVGKSDATISGFLKDAFGNVIVNLDPAKVNVYVSSHAGAWYNANTDVSKGTFSAQVAAGTWYLGYWVDVATGYVSQTDDSEVTVNSGEKRSVDLALVRSNSSIAGTVKAADGKPLAGAWVSVDQRSFSAAGTLSQTTTGVSSFMVGGNSDANGAFRVSVPQGTYFVHAYLPATSGYINPPEATVTVVSGQTASVAIVFKKPDAFVSGMITSNGKGVAAFVWAWAESGGYANARADSQGKYSLTASRNQRWHIAASLESAGAFFKASDSVIDIKDESALTQDIVVLPVVMSAQAVERVVETVKPQAIELSDGAKAILPANALAASGSANVSMKPSVETPSFGSSSVVGTSYQVEAKDTGGTSITTLNSDMTITIPYDEKELEAKGLRPEDLALSFFDEATGARNSLEKQAVDKTSKTVSGTVAHLTPFALVAPADTTPP